MGLEIFVICVIVTLSNAMPLSRRLVDMTHVFKDNTSGYPGMKEFKIDDLHNGTSEMIGGLWLQMEEYSSGTHIGTHMDAPSHFIKGGANIDDIPPTEFFGPAAVIDITSKSALDSDAEVTVEDLLLWESATGQNLNGTILLLNSGWGQKWNDRPAYYGNEENGATDLHFPGFSPVACQWLVENRSIKGIGTDTLSLDKGSTTSEFLSHVTVLGNGIFVLENVANVDKIPIYGSMLYVFPMKIGKASGAPTRIVASIPEVIYELPSE
ncbi:isatin hydrolase [Parasteatoda tepidariorum]|uniref:isatin hydrolase n=1 Tax=Parasteatoda tepidariorum TaxID=114398 RepID=UPI00077FD51D|nr:isatin hydrolase [Parasteatoda tepidariorum]